MADLCVSIAFKLLQDVHAFLEELYGFLGVAHLKIYVSCEVIILG